MLADFKGWLSYGIYLMTYLFCCKTIFFGPTNFFMTYFYIYLLKYIYNFNFWRNFTKIVQILPTLYLVDHQSCDEWVNFIVNYSELDVLQAHVSAAHL